MGVVSYCIYCQLPNWKTSRSAYDLHRKFGSEMAAESSRKMGGEKPSLSGISSRRRRSDIPFRSPRGPLQSTVIKELRGQEAAISFLSNPFRKRAFVRGRPETKSASLLRC